MDIVRSSLLPQPDERCLIEYRNLWCNVSDVIDDDGDIVVVDDEEEEG